MYFLLRRLHSLTGIVFGGYLVVHLVVNATILQSWLTGLPVYQTQVNKIHDLPLLPLIEWTFIYLPILYHTVIGIWITVTGQPNVNHYPYGKNWAYTLQRVSAIILVFFILFHVLSLKYWVFGDALGFDPHASLKTINAHMLQSWWVAWVIYPIGITASCFHLANGFWTGAITWGLTVSSASQRRWGYVCALLFVITMAAGFAALVGSVYMDPAKIPAIH